MLVSEFHYDLPAELIAQQPLRDRSGSRLLHLHRASRDGEPGSWQDRSFREFPSLLRANDLLVLNNTRVFPARLYGHRSGHRAQAVSHQNPAAHDFLRGRVEVLLTRQVSADPNEWECLVKPGRKIGVGEKLYFGGDSHISSARGFPSGLPLDPQNLDLHPELEAEVTERGSFGERHIRFAPVADFFARIDRIGNVPLPPYIRRENSDQGSALDGGEGGKQNESDRVQNADKERYQTVYAQPRGSVAAPTAGLHFTPEILEQIRDHSVEIAEITLHVGLGTFQPVRVEKVEDHTLHREWYEIPDKAAFAINQAKAERRRVVAVGTTTVRTLEFAAKAFADKHASEGAGKEAGVESGQGEADMFIYPGYRFRLVDALLTNFHLPQSTLLMLVCALGGKELVMRGYQHAVQSGYRFYSYGDCMFVE